MEMTDEGQSADTQLRYCKARAERKEQIANINRHILFSVTEQKDVNKGNIEETATKVKELRVFPRMWHE